MILEAEHYRKGGERPQQYQEIADYILTSGFDSTYLCLYTEAKLLFQCIIHIVSIAVFPEKLFSTFPVFTGNVVQGQQKKDPAI